MVEREASGGDGVDEAEVITFKHACCKCGHIVASHRYQFEVDDEFQQFEMECGLCGYAQHEASIEPFDPRLAPDPLL
jgi:ribosomal protein S27AE